MYLIDRILNMFKPNDTTLHPPTVTTTTSPNLTTKTHKPTTERPKLVNPFDSPTRVTKSLSI